MDINSTMKTNAVHNILWSSNPDLIFLLHILARLGHHQAEHVKHKTEITEV
jgi:hypothetical protein